MNCKILIPNKNIYSETSEQLSEIYKIDNVEDLKKKYAYFLTEDFKNRFGDWLNESDESYRDRVNQLGEPMLYEDEFGNYYVLDKEYNKLPINNRRFEGLEKLGIKELTNFKSEVTSQIAAYIFGKHVKTEDFSDLEDISFNLSKEIDNFFDFALSKIPEENKEKASNTYNFLKQYNKDWKLELIDFFKSKTLEYIDTENFDDNISQTEKEEKGLGVDLTPSFEKNSKGNATSKIKLLLSFLPEIDANNKIVYGKYVVAPKLLSFNQVWFDLEKELKDIPKVLKGNKVVDPFEVMKEKLKVLSIRKPYLKALLYKLDKLDVNTQTQFVTAFSNNTILDFDTVEIDGKEKSRSYRRLNAAETTNKSNKILNDWGIDFQREFIKNQKGIDTFDLSKFNSKIKSFNEFKKDFEVLRRLAIRNKQVSEDKKENLDSYILRNIELFKNALKGFGITTSSEALDYYLSDMGNITFPTQDSYIKNMIKFVNGFDFLTGTISKKPRIVINKDVFVNPFLETALTKQTSITDLAKANAFFNQEISENTLIAADKTLWKYSLSSHINDKINIWKKDNSELNKILSRPGSSNSVFAAELIKNKAVLESLKLKMTSTIQEKGKAAEGTDNTSTSEVDALNRDIFEVLGHLVYGGLPTYQTPTPADKSTAYKLAIDYFIESGAREVENEFNLNDKVLNIFTNYFEDEYVRAIKAKNDIIEVTDKDGNIDTENLIQYYHANKNGYVLEVRDRDNKVLLETNNSNSARDFIESLDKKASIVFAGNAFKNSIVPSLSFDRINKEHKDIPRGTFYKTTGEPIIDSNKLTPTQRDILKVKFKSIIQQVIKNTINTANNTDILSKEGNNNNIDTGIWNKYKGNTIALFGDYVVNSMIAQMEFSKLFSGDIAMHKNIVDYFKRVPGTYISGQSLRLGLEENDHKFKITVLNDVYKDSSYLKQMPTNIRDYYKGINQADAQAYITPKRWKFLKERLGQWSNKHEKLYNKILNSNFSVDSLTPKEVKLISAQPLKGVYRSLLDGRPVYLKYSQAVLLPGITEGSPLANLKNQMESQNIDEAIMNSGVKIGANIVKNVTEDILEGNDFKLTEINLDNRFWKLQQDLPTKLYKDTLVGSQIQKNIFNNIKFDKDYDGLSGKELYKQLHNVVSALSDTGKGEIISQLSLGTDYVIKDWSNFTKSIVDQLKQQGMDNNIVKAVEKEMSPYVLPQARTKILNTIFSMINKKTIKIKTNGGSLIQMSNFGLSSKQAEDNGVYWLKNPEELAEPRLIKDENGNKKVLSGQVFINASFISEYIPDWKSKSPEELFGKINKETGKREGGLVDARALELIGYRIPNQGTSSNDSLEVVGILPEYYGDTIVTYTGITTKTGSDFDIDKMFIMMPHLKPVFKGDVLNYLRKSGLTNKIAKNILNKVGYYTFDKNSNFKNDPVEELYYYVINNDADVTNLELSSVMNKLKSFIQNQPDVKLEYIEFDNEAGFIGNSKKALQNKLVELYHKVLKSEHTYNDLMTPLDFPFMENDIKELYDLNNKNINDLEMLSPFYQIKIKYEFLAGQFGIGQVANQLVDHMRGQTSDLKLSFYLGWGNYKSNKNGKYTVFDVNENGENISEKVDGLDSVPIDNSISAILNAFVDIAKDPYITIANWNTLTTNMGLMLIRAGVHPFKVNAFLGQPVLKKLARETFSREGKLRLTTKSSSTLIDELSFEYKEQLFDILEKEFKDKNNISSLSENEEVRFQIEAEEFYKKLISKDYYKFEVNGKTLNNRIQYRKIGDLRRNIKDSEFQKSKEFVIDQILTLKEYDKLNTITKNFRLTVSNSKFGETGAGINPVQLMITKNNVSSILNDSPIKGFDSKFVNNDIGLTSLGSYYNNSIGLVSELIEANPKLFLTSTEFFRQLFNEIASETHSQKEYLNDENLGKILDESLYSAILSGFNYFKAPSKIEDKRKFFNNLFNNLYLEIENLKKTSNNFLIKELELKKDGKFNFIGINGARNKPVEYNNKITDAWYDLSKTNKELSDNLIKYAYYQSGFRNNINAIFKYIPHEVFIENDLNEYINFISKDKENSLDFENIKEQIYRHNWNNSKIVPKINSRDIAKTGKTKKTNEHYVILRSDSNRHTGINDFGVKTYPPFITKDYFRQEVLPNGEVIKYPTEKLLYKLHGYQNMGADLGIEPVYVKTYKLGYKSNKGQFHEYNINNKVNNSIYSDNNITKDTKDFTEKMINLIRSKREYTELNSNDFGAQVFEREYKILPNITKFEENNLDNSEKSSILEDNENNPLDC